MYFYISTNIGKCEPDSLKAVDYIHIKARADGNETAVITVNEVVDENLRQLSQEQMQAELDAWIDAENENPSVDVEGNILLQNKINLGAYLD